MAVLDFFFVFEKIKSCIEKMIIDEDKQFPLSRYLKDGKKDSDHNTLIMYMEITFMEKKQERIEMFNFKSLEGKEEFFKLTEKNRELVICFQTEENIEKQSDAWFKALNKYFHQSFKKIRSCKNKKKINEVDELLMKRSELV
jgi:hypothetical protein